MPLTFTSIKSGWKMILWFYDWRMRKDGGGESGPLSQNNVILCMFILAFTVPESVTVKGHRWNSDTPPNLSSLVFQLYSESFLVQKEGANLLLLHKIGKQLCKAMGLLRNCKYHFSVCLKNAFLYLILLFMIHFSSG